MTASDAGSGVAATEYRVDGGPWTEGSAFTVSGDGEHQVEYRSTDQAGNREAARSARVRIDARPPETTLSGADDAWHAEDVALTLTASDAGSGVAATEYRVDGGPWTEGSAFTVSGDGEHQVEYRSIDQAGNREAARSARVRIDARPPETTLSGADDAWHAEDVALTLTASDAGSGVAATEYRVDGGPWTEGSAFTVSGDGEHQVEYRSTDQAGNREAARSARVRIDARPPETTLSGADDAWHAEDVALTLTASDAGSGVAATEYRVDGGPWTEGSAFTVSGDGEHQVEYRSTDQAGNREAARSARVRIDARPPETVPTPELHAKSSAPQPVVELALSELDVEPLAPEPAPESPSKPRKRRGALVALAAAALIIALIVGVVASRAGSHGEKLPGPDLSQYALQATTLDGLGSRVHEASDSYQKVLASLDQVVAKNTVAVKAWDKQWRKKSASYQSEVAAVQAYNSSPAAQGTPDTPGTPAIYDDYGNLRSSATPGTLGKPSNKKPLPPKPKPPAKIKVSLRSQRQQLRMLKAQLDDVSAEIAAVRVSEEFLAVASALRRSSDALTKRVELAEKSLATAVRRDPRRGEIIVSRRLKGLDPSNIVTAVQQVRSLLFRAAQAQGIEPTGLSWAGQSQ